MSNGDQSAASAQGVDIGGWLTTGFNLFTSQWQVWLRLAAPAVGAQLVFALGLYAAMAAPMALAAPRGGWVFFGVVLLLGGAAVALVGLAAWMYLSVGLWKAALRQARGGTPSKDDLRSPKDLWVPGVVAQLAAGAAISIGWMLCFVPGLAAAGLLYYVVPLVIDKRMPLQEAVQKSRELTMPNWQTLALYALWAFLVMFISSIGSYLCLIGLVVTMPLLYTLSATAYVGVMDAGQAPGVSPSGAPSASLPPAPPAS